MVLPTTNRQNTFFRFCIPRGIECTAFAVFGIKFKILVQASQLLALHLQVALRFGKLGNYFFIDCVFGSEREKQKKKKKKGGGGGVECFLVFLN